jgi:hypothetical protein
MRQNEGTRSPSPRRLIATRADSRIRRRAELSIKNASGSSMIAAEATLIHSPLVQVQVEERMRVVELGEGARQFPALARGHLTQFGLVDHV